VTGMDDGGFGELHEFVFEGGDDLIEGAAPKIGAPNAACEERVASEELRVSESGVGSIGGQVERDATGSVTRSVHDISEEIAPLQRVAFLE